PCHRHRARLAHRLRPADLRSLASMVRHHRWTRISGRPRGRRGPEDGGHQMVKRLSRIPRTNVELPDEVMAAFRQALKIRDHRERQLADGSYCPGIGACETCDEYERVVAIVDTALSVRPSELSPVDVI